MAGDGGFSISTFIGPALIATAISLLINLRAEKKKAERDFVTKLFDGAREDARKAVEAAVEYYPLAAQDRTELLEAKVWMAERDVRESLVSLSALCTQKATRAALENAFADFIDALTGGTFQNKRAKADLEQARKVATQGAALRVAIATARQSDLHIEIANDLLSKFMAFCRDVGRSAIPATKKYIQDFRESRRNGDQCG